MTTSTIAKISRCRATNRRQALPVSGSHPAVNRQIAIVAGTHVAKYESCNVSAATLRLSRSLCANQIPWATLTAARKIQNPMASAQCHRVIAIMSADAQDTRLNTSVIGVSWPFGAIATTLIVMVLPSAEMLLTPLLFTRPPTLATMLTEESSMMVSE